MLNFTEIYRTPKNIDKCTTVIFFISAHIREKLNSNTIITLIYELCHHTIMEVISVLKSWLCIHHGTNFTHINKGFINRLIAVVLGNALYEIGII